MKKPPGYFINLTADLYVENYTSFICLYKQLVVLSRVLIAGQGQHTWIQWHIY